MSHEALEKELLVLRQDLLLKLIEITGEKDIELFLLVCGPGKDGAHHAVRWTNFNNGNSTAALRKVLALIEQGEQS